MISDGTACLLEVDGKYVHVGKDILELGNNLFGSLLFLLFLVLGIPALALVVTAPAALRAMRRLGVWQANIAVEGLYLAVR